MMYNSTRDRSVSVTAAQAITTGISEEGGLFVPATMPKLTAADMESFVSMSYVELATAVLSRFLTDFTEEEVRACAAAAYSKEHFGSDEPAPLHKMSDNIYLQELWHGPTCAFKDMALQILPHLMRVSAEKTGDNKEIVILVATSGDTGKAALEGFRDAPNTRILVFYPEDGVSPMQKLQMTTQEGNNVGVCAIRGNFDDAQSGVKKIFTDPRVRERLAQQGMKFSSANSINWGRLVPQIVYYVSAYCDLVKQGAIAMGDPINVTVPTGNFGNILAAYYAREMGLPIKKLICASNSNNVLTDFITTGTYDRNRAFYTTTSPSMDILISSNLERLLYHLSGEDDVQVAAWMKQLAQTGRYTVSDDVRAKMQEVFEAGWCSDDDAKITIGAALDGCHYLSDPHTAVAINVHEQYLNRTQDTTTTVIASTANAYKFAASVSAAFENGKTDMDEFERLEWLNEFSKHAIPAPLSGLRDKTPRFTGCCDKENMEQAVYDLLNVR